MKKIEEEEVKKSHVLSLEGTLSWTDNPESTDSSNAARRTSVSVPTLLLAVL